MDLPAALSNVPPSTAATLAYSMLVIVAIFLTTGPVLVLLYRRKSKKRQMEQAPSPA